ncbi:MAG: SGNH/GDSL hydrolase family protein [Planctomycetota bacterium]
MCTCLFVLQSTPATVAAQSPAAQAPAKRSQTNQQRQSGDITDANDQKAKNSKRATKQQPKANAKPKRKNPAMVPPKHNPDLPNVLLIGDSISIGYTVAVRKRLEGVANVYRPLTNCGPTTRGIEQIDQWLGDRRWDIIHFNFGLHDLKYMGPNGENLADPKDPGSGQQVPIDAYAKNLRKLVLRMQKTRAKLIWRQTTPVPQGAKGRIVGDSKRYNDAAAKVMESIGGIALDPMFEYASVAPIVAAQQKANVHYTPDGSKMLAERVAQSIRAQLRSIK